MLSKRFKEFRILTNLSQEQLAEKLECPYQTISKYERGLVKPSSDILTKIGENLGININWLLTGNGSMFLPQKSDKQQKYEQALSERKTIGQRLNWLQGEEHIEDEMLSKETGIDERRIRKIGLDELEPTVSEVNKICDYFGITLDLFVNGRVAGDSACAKQILSPEEKKMLEFLKKAKENKLI